MSKIETTLNPTQIRIAEALFGGSYGVRIGARAGNPVHVPVPVADMPEAAIVKMFAYGVQRTFNDAIGGSDTTQAEKVTAAEKMVEAYLAGQVGRRAVSTVDPVMAEIFTMLRPAAKADWLKTHDADAWKARDEEEIEADLQALFDGQSEDVQTALQAAANESLATKAAARKAKDSVLSLLKK